MAKCDETGGTRASKISAAIRGLVRERWGAEKYYL